MTDKELIEELQKQIRRKDADLTAAKKAEKEEIDRKHKAIDTGVGCLRAVKAMLQNSSYGATHRQRNFYGEAIIKFIDNAVVDMESEKESYPF